MKTKLIALAVAAIAAPLTVSLVSNQAAAAAPVAAAPATPLGRLVEIQLIAWPLSTAIVGKVNGTLIAMPTGWLVVSDGSFEHWVPVEKVMSMRVSR
jgi:hypothetical protein